MNGFEKFFRENVRGLSEIDYKVSDRFQENFKIKAISEEQHEGIRTMAMKMDRNNKSTFDMNKYAYLLCAESVIYPDLHNAALQDDYGVKNAVELIKKMVNAGEFTRLFAKVKEVNGFDVSFEELVSEAKN